MLTETVEEKYGKTSTFSSAAGARISDDEASNGTNSSTDSEEEDDEGVLALGALDAQIQDTLEAIRRKDPRLYDAKAVFYTNADEEPQDDVGRSVEKEKPVYLGDYHRKNLLESAAFVDGRDFDDHEEEPTTYVQQQDDLKKKIVKEMHAAAEGDQHSKDSHSDGVGMDGSDGEFLVQKTTPQEEPHPKQVTEKMQKVNVETAEEDPDEFLSNFMSARAWVPSAGSRFQPFESDDEEEERRAELFEEAYNLRFEDPKTSNETLTSHARDAVAKYSVRKDISNPRKKARDLERQKQAAAKQIREEEKAQLRKLKIAKVEAKVKKIKEAAGFAGQAHQEQDWSSFLKENWDDARWEAEMKKRFGDDYYAEPDPDDSVGGKGKVRRKLRKPKWRDDIDIGDLVPDFDSAGSQVEQLQITDDGSSTDETSTKKNDIGESEVNKSNEDLKRKHTLKDKREKEEQKNAGRRERRKIEQLVEQNLKVDETLSSFGKKHAGYFRYRDTSPTAYGLTAKDILMASDGQLNQFAGLKKMAAFRDSDKKKKDKKRLAKKARLRQWRKDTFGNEQGPQATLAEVLAGSITTGQQDAAKEAGSSDTRQGITKRRKTRSKKHKVMGSSA